MKRCSAITLSGYVCKRRPAKDSEKCYQHSSKERSVETRRSPEESPLTYEQAIARKGGLCFKLKDENGKKLMDLILSSGENDISPSEFEPIRMIHKPSGRAWKLRELFDLNRGSSVCFMLKQKKCYVKVPDEGLMKALAKFFVNGFNVNWTRDIPITVNDQEYRSSEVRIKSVFAIVDPEGAELYKGFWSPRGTCPAKTLSKEKNSGESSIGKNSGESPEESPNERPEESPDENPEKYLFHLKTCRSYTRKELVAANSNTRIQVFTRDNKLIGDIAVPEERIEEQIRAIPTRPDVSRTNGDQVCPLTMEEWENPYICILNGRSYSRNALEKAIEKTLLIGEPLRLEDTTLLPENLGPDLVFYPNKSLGGEGEPLQFDLSKLKIPPYDESLVMKEDIPKVSDFLKQMKPGPSWDYEGLWKVYAQKRGYDPGWSGVRVSIRRVVIRDQEFPPPGLHPKCDTGHISFVNVLFIGCSINMNQCWCGLDIKTSLFRRCTLIQGKPGHRQARIVASRAENCTKVNA